jgi:hypothetical protein
VRDPLDGGAREGGALAGTSSFQYAPVDGTACGLQLIEAVQAVLATQAGGRIPGEHAGDGGCGYRRPVLPRRAPRAPIAVGVNRITSGRS